MANHQSKLSKTAKLAGLPMRIRTTHGRVTLNTHHDESTDAPIYEVQLNDGPIREFWMFEAALSEGFRLLASLRAPKAVKPDPFADDSESFD